jgi:hypothetical protein
LRDVHSLQCLEFLGQILVLSGLPYSAHTVLAVP